jgi:hypothetical protein
MTVLVGAWVLPPGPETSAAPILNVDGSTWSLEDGVFRCKVGASKVKVPPGKSGPKPTGILVFGPQDLGDGVFLEQGDFAILVQGLGDESDFFLLGAFLVDSSGKISFDVDLRVLFDELAEHILDRLGLTGELVLTLNAGDVRTFGRASQTRRGARIKVSFNVRFTLEGSALGPRPVRGVLKYKGSGQLVPL